MPVTILRIKDQLFEIASERIMRKKVPKNVKSVISKFPDIGQQIEKIVEDANIGADRWRRTGMYTFTGDIKKEKHLTFTKLQEKLCEHYCYYFSYGIVVHLCAARNKRSLSSQRYKGVANVRFQQA